MESLNLTTKAVCAAIMCAIAVPALAAKLYAVLEPDGNGYRLRDTFVTSVDERDRFDKKLSGWPMDSDSSFAPAFRTERFECVIKTRSNIDECQAYQELEAKFVHLNSFKSGYGDTPAERKTASEKVATAVKTAAAGVILAPAVIVSSPLILFGLAMGTVTKRWVEFNHDAFNEAVDTAVKKAGFASREEWTENRAAIAEVVVQLENAENKAYEEAKNRRLRERTALEPYIKVGISAESFPSILKRFTFPPIPIRSDAVNAAAIANQISQHYAAQTTDYAEQVKSEVERLKPSYEARLAELAESERQAKIRAAEEERQAKIRAAEEAQLAKKEEKMQKERERQQLAALSRFRSKLEIGADTHCGPIIEIKGPMVKVAVNVPLSGYGTEAWLKRGEIYTPAYGCHNLNGKLSPLSFPG